MCIERGMDMEKKVRVNISITSDTAERLKQYALEHHTNVSQAITNWIWSEKLEGGAASDE